MILKKIFFLLSLLVSPKVFSGGDSGLPHSLIPPNDLLVGRIEVFAEAANDFETFRVEMETYYSLNVNQKQLLLITVDHYKQLVCSYCNYLEEQSNPAIKQIQNGSKQKI